MDFSLLLHEIGSWVGIVSFISLGLLIFSGDTARLWDRVFGMDRIIKTQRKFSLFISAILIFHPVLFMVSNKLVLPFLIPNFTYIPLALGITAFYLFVATMIASTFYKRVSYRAWQYIHIVTYLLYFFALYHAINLGSDADKLMPVYIIITSLVILGIIFRTNHKLKIWKRGPAKVLRVGKETHDSFSLYVEVKPQLKFKAGQFCFLRLDINKLHARHPFTIASAPNEEQLRFTIKLAGRFTETARSLVPGMVIHIDGPFGRFTPPLDQEIVCIAGGVGITPFISIIKDRINNNCNKSITLFYCCKSINDIIYLSEFKTMKYSWLKIVYVLNDVNNADIVCESGFITKEIIEKHLSNAKDLDYYVCGPELMKSSVYQILKTLGVSSSRIRTEDFFW